MIAINSLRYKLSYLLVRKFVEIRLNDKIIVTEYLVVLHHNFVILPKGYTGIKAHFCRLYWN